MPRVSKKTSTKPKTGVKRAPSKKPAAKPAKKSAAAPRKKISRTKPAKPVPRVRRVAKSPLPESYGTRQLFLVARDPRWLYAHWDFSHAEQRALNKLSATGHLALRIRQDSAAGELVAESKLHAELRHWFVPVGSGDTRYVAELGYKNKAGVWITVVVSNTVVTPPETITPETPDMPVIFATLPPDVPFQEILQTLGAVVSENVPLVEVVRQFQAAERNELAAAKIFALEQQWSPRQARILARITGVQNIQRRMRGELSSLGLARIIPPGAARGPLTGLDFDSGESSSSPAGGWSGDWS